jgi:hypothetical protein
VLGEEFGEFGEDEVGGTEGKRQSTRRRNVCGGIRNGLGR